MIGMLVAGIGLVLAGLLAIGYGVQYKEFSVGSTLILSGVVGACTGLIMFGLWVAVRELRDLAQRLGGACRPSRVRNCRCRRPRPSRACRGAAPRVAFLFSASTRRRRF